VDIPWGCRPRIAAATGVEIEKRSEALSVRVQDVQRNDYRAVQLLGKGRKQRTVPLWNETAQHIRAWLKHAGLKPDQPLLPNRFGRPMTRTAVQQRLQLHVQTAQANCPSLRRRHISPHTIRHATAMILLQSGIAPPVIALWLGHEDPATTHQYIEADLLLLRKGDTTVVHWQLT